MSVSYTHLDVYKRQVHDLNTSYTSGDFPHSSVPPLATVVTERARLTYGQTDEGGDYLIMPDVQLPEIILNENGKISILLCKSRNYDIDVKLGTFQTICETIDRIFRNTVRRDTKLKLYKVMAL